MRQRICFLLFSILVSCGIYAQGETAHWFFGNNAGLDFSNLQTINTAIVNSATGQTLAGLPKPISGPIYTEEGCFSVSDRNGKFLFASDGTTVYNAVEQSDGTLVFNTMKNGTGLRGHSSATQSGIVVPRPETPGHFYIITVPCRILSSVKEIHYSEVDLTVTNSDGLGEVVAATKNTKLNLSGLVANQAYENIAVVGHANGKDYWLVHRSRGYFFVWLITKDGFTLSDGTLSSNPYKMIPIGLDPGAPSLNYGGGYLKFSMDAKKIMHTCYYDYRTVLADFDNHTGDISNIFNRSLSFRPYSGEFSPNGEYLYLAEIDAGLQAVYVTKTADYRSNGTITKLSDVLLQGRGGAVQLGPDNRIYMPDANSKNLHVILNPNEGGTQVASILNYLTSNGMFGLPAFPASFFNIGDIESDPPVPGCLNKEITFSVQIGTGSGENRVTKIEWDFGDGSPVEGENDMDKYIFSKTHTYTKQGTYLLTLTLYKSDGSVLSGQEKTLEVKINSCKLPVNHNISVMEYYD